MHFPAPKKVNAKNIQFPKLESQWSQKEMFASNINPSRHWKKKKHSESPRKIHAKKKQRVLSHTFKIIQISSKPLGKISDIIKSYQIHSRICQRSIKSPSKIHHIPMKISCLAASGPTWARRWWRRHKRCSAPPCSPSPRIGPAPEPDVYWTVCYWKWPIYSWFTYSLFIKDGDSMWFSIATMIVC